MKPIDPKEVSEMARNVALCYKKASDEEKRLGHQWYSIARTHCKRLSVLYGVSEEVAASVVAALSPNCSWTINLADSENLLDAHSRGLPVDSITVSTYNRNKIKAWAIVSENKPSLLSGQKVTAFRDCILNPMSQAVCVDGHAYSIAKAVRFTITGANKAPTLTAHRFKTVQEAYRKVANRLGIAPYKVQATTWTSHRRTINGLDRQPVLWE